MELYSEDFSLSSPIAETKSLSSADTSAINIRGTIKTASFKSKLEAFDQAFETAIDYFAVIGFDEK